MKFSAAIFVLAAALAFVSAEVYFKEDFGEDWEKRWVQSEFKDDYGKFVRSHGKFFGDEEQGMGIQTSEDAKFYAISAKFDKTFSNEGKDLVVQFSVKHEQKIDCGGGYLKLFKELEPKKLNGDSAYNIMFGPDICGGSNEKVHVIFNYKGTNHLTKKKISPKTDVYSHLYTLVVKPDNSYKVLIDGEEVERGTMEADWDMVPPKKIKDPEAKKPEDWVDNAKIDDPEDSKPEDWEKPEHIPDPDAAKPDDWDDEMDGEWEPPMIDNPEFKGEWKPKQIDNPDFKGLWVHPEIDNPEYFEDDKMYLYEFGAVGFDLWQVKSGTIFDNVLITDDLDTAMKAVEDFKGLQEAEKKMNEELEKEQEKKAKEESASQDAVEADEDNEDEDDNEDDEDDNEDDEDNKVKDEL